MKISVTQENLAKALSTVSRVASSKAGLPILNNILLKTENNRLLIAGTNLEIASTVFIGAKVEKTGTITVPARIATDFITTLPKGIVDITVKNNKVTFSTEGYKSIINGVVSDEFPDLPSIDEDKAIHYTISVDDFKKSVEQTTITSSKDSSRPVLTGVYWHSYDGYLYLAATDGYRLSEKKLMKTKSELKAIVPTTTLKEVQHLLSDNTEQIDVLFDDSQVRFRIGDAEVISQLISGAYPEYRNLIPEETESKIIMNTADFVRTVKVAGLFARESGGSIVLSADAEKNELSVYSIASEIGENTSIVKGDVTKDGKVTLNSRYISEALSVIDADKLVFAFGGSVAPCVLRADGKTNDYQHIIMPLKS